MPGGYSGARRVRYVSPEEEYRWRWLGRTVTAIYVALPAAIFVAIVVMVIVSAVADGWGDPMPPATTTTTVRPSSGGPTARWPAATTPPAGQGSTWAGVGTR